MEHGKYKVMITIKLLQINPISALNIPKDFICHQANKPNRSILIMC